MKLLIIIIFALLLLFIAFPLFQVMSVSLLDTEGHLSLTNYARLFSNSHVWEPLSNTLLLGLAVAVLSTFIGYVFAYVVVRTELPLRKITRAFGTFPMISPPFVIALAAIVLLGQNGALSNLMHPILGDDFSIYGFPGLVLVETISYFPTAFLIIVGTLSAIDPVIEDAACNLGATRRAAFWQSFFPLTRPGIYAALLLVFIESIADFGNPLILSGNYKVLSVEAYLKITGEFDLPMGATLSVVLLVPAVLAFILQKILVDKQSFVTLSGKSSGASFYKPHSRLALCTLSAVVILVCAVITLLYGAVLWGSFVKVWGSDHTLTFHNYVSGVKGSWGYIRDTFSLAAVATPVTGVFGLIIAYLVVRQNFIGRTAMEVLSMLSFAVPGTVVGVGYVLAFNDAPFLLTGTSAIIIILFIFRNMPVGIRSSIASLKQLDPSIEEAARNLGADAATTMIEITAPLLAPAFFSGVAYSFVRCLTAISAVIFVVSGSWNLLTVSLLGQVESGFLSIACALCVLLILVAGSILGGMQLWLSRVGLNVEEGDK